MKKTKKILAVLLSMAMVLSLFSGIAFAADDNDSNPSAGQTDPGKEGSNAEIPNGVVDGTTANTTTATGSYTGTYYLEGLAYNAVAFTYTYDLATDSSSKNFIALRDTSSKYYLATAVGVTANSVIEISSENSDSESDDNGENNASEISVMAGNDSDGHIGIIVSLNDNVDIGTYMGIYKIAITYNGKTTVQHVYIYYTVTCNGDSSHNEATATSEATCTKGGYTVTYCADETYSGSGKLTENDYGLYTASDSSLTYVKVGNSYYRVLTSKLTEATGHKYSTSYDLVYYITLSVYKVTTIIDVDTYSKDDPNSEFKTSTESELIDTIEVTDDDLSVLLSGGYISIDEDTGLITVDEYEWNSASGDILDLTSELGLTYSKYVSYYIAADDNVEVAAYAVITTECTVCGAESAKTVSYDYEYTVVKYLSNDTDLTCDGVYYYYEGIYYGKNSGTIIYDEEFVVYDYSETGNHIWNSDVTLSDGTTPSSSEVVGTTTQYVCYDGYWAAEYDADGDGTAELTFFRVATDDDEKGKNGVINFTSDGKNAIVSEDEALSYTYEINKYSSVKMIFTCSLCGYEYSVNSKSVDVVSIIAPTCDTDGSVTYTATYEGSSKTYTVTWTETIEAVGHNYLWEEWSYKIVDAVDENGDAVEMVYGDDGDVTLYDYDGIISVSKELTLYCSHVNCEGEDGETTPESVTVTVEGEIVEDSYVASTCTTMGEVTYYFEYTSDLGITYSTYATVYLEVLEHDYKIIGTEWIINDTTGYAYGAIITYVCNNDCCEGETWQSVVPAGYYVVEPTCTEDGAVYVYAYVNDTVNLQYIDGDTSLESVVIVEKVYEVLEATGHNYKSYVSDDGLTVTYECITCGDTYIEVALNGLCYDSESGNWYYYVANEVDTDYTGFASNSLGEWYVKEGVVQFVTGLYYINGTWYYLTNGLLASDYTGFATNSAGTWYVESGVVDFGYTGLATVDGTTYYVYKNLVATATGLYRVDGTWYYFVDGAIASDYTGFAANAYGTWYVVNGIVDFSVKGLVTVDGATYYVAGNKLITNTGLYKISGTWYYFVEGMVASYYTGLASNAGYSWYVENGIVDFTYTGTYESGNYTYNIVSSRVVSYTYTVVY